MKYYAVRKGRTPGIYLSWGDCWHQIDKFSGAEFKSFEDEAEAVLFLQAQEKREPVREDLAAVYIDGSYSQKNACYSWGGFIDQDGQRLILQGTGNNPDYLPERNIAGELLGTLRILEECKRRGLSAVNLFYDYSGIEAYTTGAWKAKTPLAQYYLSAMSDILTDLQVYFHHIHGHTGNAGNELADILAKEAAGAQLRKKDLATLQEFKASGICL